MKNPIAKLIAGYRKLVATPYDVPVDHAYSQKTMAEQKIVQDAAEFFAERTGKPVTVTSNIPTVVNGRRTAS